jgi:FkbM family methyltransferase
VLNESAIEALRRLSWAQRLLPARFVLATRVRLQRALSALEPEFDLLPILASRDRVSVDAGANMGTFSYALSKLSAAVYAFEPLADLAGFLMRARLPNVHVANVALSDHMGYETLRVPLIAGRPSSTRASLGGHPAEFIEHRVAVSTLDAQQLGDVGFIKIDVEGHELRLLAGAAETIARCRPSMLIELEPRRLQGGTIDDAFARMESWGYRGFFYDEHAALRPVSDFDPARHQARQRRSYNEPYVNNFIFLPRESPTEMPRRLRIS